MKAPARAGDEGDGGGGGGGGGGDDDQRLRRRGGRRGRRRRRESLSLMTRTMATALAAFGHMPVRHWALASMLTLWATTAAVVAAPDRDAAADAAAPGGGVRKICGIPGAPPCNARSAAAAGPRSETAAGRRAAASGGKRRVCGVPGAPPCKASEEEADDPFVKSYDEDIYGTYDNLEYGEEQDNATRVEGSIPVLEAFPILEPRPPQHAQMMLQEAPPFTWLVQSDTPPRQNKEPEGEFGVDGDGNSLLGGLSGLKGRARKGLGSGGGSSHERVERSLKKAREKFGVAHG